MFNVNELKIMTVTTRIIKNIVGKENEK